MRRALITWLLDEPRRHPLPGAIFIILTLGSYLIFLFFLPLSEASLIYSPLLPVLAAGWFFGWRGGLMVGMASTMIDIVPKVAANEFWMPFLFRSSIIVPFGVLIGALQDYREQLQATLGLRLAGLEAAHDAIIITDHSGRIEWMNPAFTKVTGYPPEEALGRTPKILKSGKQSPEFYQQLWDTILAGKEWSGELINRRKDGSSYVEEMSITPIRNHLGKISNFVAIKRDITERHEAQTRVRELNLHLQRRISNLTALREIDKAITGNLEEHEVLTVILDQVIKELGVDAAAILLYRAENGVLEVTASRGFRTENEWHPDGLPLGEGLAGRVALGRRIIYSSDPSEIGAIFPDEGSAQREGFIRYWGAPLLAGGNLLGVLEVFQRSVEEFDGQRRDFLEMLGQQAAIALAEAGLYRDLQSSNEELLRAYDTTIEGWSRALDLRDKETEGHSRRVTKMTVRLAKQLGFTSEQLKHVRRGALLHDIGKMGVPDHILLKPGKLTEGEWERMRLHPTFAYELLYPIEFLRPALDIPYCHHEKWDGSGYPRGLRGEEIPLAARIFAVIDVYDALTSERPYRAAWSREKALEYILAESGKHFDPEVVGRFIRMMREDLGTPPLEPRASYAGRRT